MKIFHIFSLRRVLRIFNLPKKTTHLITMGKFIFFIPAFYALICVCVCVYSCVYVSMSVCVCVCVNASLQKIQKKSWGIQNFFLLPDSTIFKQRSCSVILSVRCYSQLFLKISVWIYVLVIPWLMCLFVYYSGHFSRSLYVIL